MNKMFPYWILEVKKLVVNLAARRWCGLSYPGHPKGCPNYNDSTKLHCPPFCDVINMIFDLSKPVYIVFSEFDLEKHVKHMKEKHPNWSDRQLRNVLYWQNRSRKQLRVRVIVAMNLLKTTASTFVPEANGVNVYATCFLSGLKLEKIKNLKMCHHIALLGFKKGLE